jgi:hypothetical protein
MLVNPFQQVRRTAGYPLLSELSRYHALVLSKQI